MWLASIWLTKSANEHYHSFVIDIRKYPSKHLSILSIKTFLNFNNGGFQFELQGNYASSGYRLMSLKLNNSELCISFNDAVVSTNGIFGSVKTRNDCIVPYQIYGIK